MKIFIILLLILLIATSMQSYKIETFANTEDTTAFPQTPNDLTCYNYIKNVKNWDVNSLMPDQKKVLFTMRTLQSTQYAPDSKIFPYKDGCVIPKEHLPIYNKDTNDTTPLDIKTDNKTTTIPYTKSDEYPEGVVVDLSTNNFDDFKKFLSDAYTLYDADQIKDRDLLMKQINSLTKTRDDLNVQLKAIKDSIAKYTSQLNILNDPNDVCQRDAKTLADLKSQNAQQEATLIDINNQISSVVDSINTAYKQIQDLQKC